MEFDFHLAFVLYLRLILHFNLKSYFFFDKTKQRKKSMKTFTKKKRGFRKTQVSKKKNKKNNKTALIQHCSYQELLRYKNSRLKVQFQDCLVAFMF